MSSMPNGWLRCRRPRPPSATKLICFPHAGGAASAYRMWPDSTGHDIEVHAVQYPGREDRLGEGLIDRMDPLVEHITAALARLALGRFALFGHSMGGAVAHEVAMRLRTLGLAQPEHLFISGRQPPQHHRGGTLHLQDDHAVLDELVRLRPANAALQTEPDLAAMVLPVVRNDYRLIETYQPTAATPLSCPITVLIGADDSELPPAQAADWVSHTERSMRLHTFPGDHFFLVDHRTAVVHTVVEALRNPVPAAAWPWPVDRGAHR